MLKAGARSKYLIPRSAFINANQNTIDTAFTAERFHKALFWERQLGGGWRT